MIPQRIFREIERERYLELLRCRVALIISVFVNLIFVIGAIMAGK